MGRRTVSHNGGTLTPWEPGQSGNPAGRPTDSQRMLKALLEANPDVVKGTAEAWNAILLNPNHKHWPAAMKEALARIDGPAGGGDGETITRGYFNGVLARIVLTIKAELDEDVAERVVRAIRDALDGVRTVNAEVRDAEPEGSG